MYLISAYFDEQSNKILNRYISTIAAKTGNTFMIDNKVPPHLTISSIEAKNVTVLIPTFENAVKTLKCGQIQFVSVGQLLPYVMYVTPVLNDYLQTMQETFYKNMKDIEETTVSKYYRPYSWLPHVTLGKKLDKEQLLTAFEIMRESFAPFTARIEEIGLAKVNPHEDVIRYKLI